MLGLHQVLWQQNSLEVSMHRVRSGEEEVTDGEAIARTNARGNLGSLHLRWPYPKLPIFGKFLRSFLQDLVPGCAGINSQTS